MPGGCTELCLVGSPGNASRLRQAQLLDESRTFLLPKPDPPALGSGFVSNMRRSRRSGRKAQGGNAHAGLRFALSPAGAGGESLSCIAAQTAHETEEKEGPAHRCPDPDLRPENPAFPSLSGYGIIPHPGRRRAMDCRCLLFDLDGTPLRSDKSILPCASAAWAWPWATPSRRCGPPRTWSSGQTTSMGSRTGWRAQDDADLASNHVQ